MGKLVPTSTLVVTPALAAPSLWHSAHVQNGTQSRPVPRTVDVDADHSKVVILAQINNQREKLGSFGRVPEI